MYARACAQLEAKCGEGTVEQLPNSCMLLRAILEHVTPLQPQPIPHRTARTGPGP